MKKIINISRIHLLLVVLFAMVLTWSCKDKMKDEIFKTDNSVLLYTYMAERDSDLFEFAKVLKLTKFASLLDAYGEYTIFAPCNDAMIEYYKRHGKTSLADYTAPADIDTLTTMVKFCIMSNIYRTSNFIEGNIPDSTLTGDFLTTSFTEEGVNGILVNREAKIILRDIDFNINNGVIHKLDKVLTPTVSTVAEMIEKDPKLTIFSQALKETGLYDLINTKTYVVDGVTKKFRVTVLTETDSIFKNANINSYEDLKARYSTTGDPKNVTDGLYRFMAYHITNSSYFISEFAPGLYSTYSGTSMIEVSDRKGVKQLNYRYFINNNTGKKDSTFVTFQIKASNNAAKNGVYHKVDTVLDIYNPPPQRVFWEPYDVPEIRGSYKGANGIVGNDFEDGQIESIRWTPGAKFLYIVNAGLRFTFGDYCGMNDSYWVEFTTPKLIAGKYQVWMATKNQTGRSKVQCYWDGKMLGVPYDMRINAGSFKRSDGKFIPNGGKASDSLILMNYDLNYYPEPKNYPNFIYSNSPHWRFDYMRKKLGTVTLTTTTTHKFKVQTIVPGTLAFDFLWFVPTK